MIVLLAKTKVASAAISTASHNARTDWTWRSSLLRPPFRRHLTTIERQARVKLLLLRPPFRRHLTTGVRRRPCGRRLLRPPFRRHLTTRPHRLRLRVRVASAAISTASHNPRASATRPTYSCFGRYFDGISQRRSTREISADSVASAAISTASHNPREGRRGLGRRCFGRHFDGISQLKE